MVIRKINLYISNFIFVYLILSFQFNLYDFGFSLKIFFGILTLIIVINSFKNFKFITYFMFLSLLLFFYDLKYIFLLIYFLFGIIYSNFYENKKNILFNLIIYCNALVMCFQLTGEFGFLSVFQDYYISESISIFDSNDWFPLFQIRPSGIFPSTIYLSFFLSLAVAYVLNLKATKYNNLIYIFIALSLVVSGSTFGLLMCLLIIIFNFNIILSFYILLSTIIYCFFIPDYFLNYNYSLEDLFSSIQTRITPNSDGSFNSLISKNLLFFGTFLFLLMFFLYFKKLHKNFILIINIIIILIPLIIHDFIFSIAYSFFCGYLLNLISSNAASLSLYSYIKLLKFKI